jgi:putative cardiolipin synthase
MQSVRLISLITISVLVAGCATAPFDYPREYSEAIAANADSEVRTVAGPWQKNNLGHSGFYPLITGIDALSARLWLIDAARTSVDVQCFLMKDDAAGLQVIGRLLQAADRGVRIRFLLDDAYSSIDDKYLMLADSHSDVEVRIYNPIARRGNKWVNYLGDFRRANRRMHHKSFTADNQITIVGGRNIANKYFDMRPKEEFIDLDVMGIGPIARDVNDVFDRFWNHGWSLPVTALRGILTAPEAEAARQDVSESLDERDDAVHSDLNWPERLSDGSPFLYTAKAELVTDEPGKLEVPVARGQMLLANRLDEEIREATSEVIVLTPYLIPGKVGFELLRSTSEKGVRVVILTNSLASNHHAFVHSSYSGYRKKLLKAGVELYEINDDAFAREFDAESATLHIKGMIVDRRRTFIGSPNFDPRSLELNSEVGLIIESDAMGSRLAEGVMQRLPDLAYRVETNSRGKLRWRKQVDGVDVIEKSEPGASFRLRFLAWLLRILPDQQL